VSDIWLSKTSVPDASTAILLGSIPEKTIKEECKNYPKGVLWIAPTETEPTCTEKYSGLIISRCTDSNESIMEAIRHILRTEYEKQPVVKASKSTETTSQKLYATILEMVISEVDSTFRSRKTRDEVGYQRQFQVFENLSGYLQGRVPEEWRDLANNSLAVVVGAGPSLDHTLSLIKEGFPKPVIYSGNRNSFQPIARQLARKMDKQCSISIGPCFDRRLVGGKRHCKDKITSSQQRWTDCLALRRFPWSVSHCLGRNGPCRRRNGRRAICQ